MLPVVVSSRTIKMSEAVKKNQGSHYMAKGGRSRVRVAGVIFQRGKRRLDRLFGQCSGASQAVPSTDPTTSAICCSQSLVTRVPRMALMEKLCCGPTGRAFHKAATGHREES